MFLAGIVFSLSLFANPPGGGDGGTPDPGGDPDAAAIPIDGGISLLLAAGAALGAKKLYDNKKSTH